jgi:hypothetical protein
MESELRGRATATLFDICAAIHPRSIRPVRMRIPNYNLPAPFIFPLFSDHEQHFFSIRPIARGSRQDGTIGGKELQRLAALVPRRRTAKRRIGRPTMAMRRRGRPSLMSDGHERRGRPSPMMAMRRRRRRKRLRRRRRQRRSQGPGRRRRPRRRRSQQAPTTMRETQVPPTRRTTPTLRKK